MPDTTAARERRPSPCDHPDPAAGPRGDQDALYRAHAARLRATVRTRVRASDDQVDDACALAWLILLRAQPRRETAFAWLVTVAVREVWRLVRSDGLDAPLLPYDGHDALEGLATDPDPLAALHARERLQAVATALPERKRRLVVLLALGYSYAEIGAFTGDSYRTLDRQLTRAQRLLDPLREPLVP